MIREVDVKFYVYRDGAIYSELYSVSPPALRMDTTAGIKMSMQGEFLANANVNWLTDTVHPTLVVDGTETPLGVFLPAAARDTENETTKSIVVELYDRCWQVRDSLTERRLFLRAGTNYVEAIKTLLVEAGVSLVLATPTTETLAEAREDWDIGSSRLEIINQLLGEINYNELWFNADGVAIVEPATVPTAANIKHTLDATDVTSLLLPSKTSELDFYSAPNVFICVCSNADKEAPLVATAVNDNPQSPLSVTRRGRRLATVIRVDNVASQRELNNYARRMRDNSVSRGEVIQVQTALHPGYGAFDVTAINYGDTVAICTETAWEMELRTGGTMTHTLERVVYALD